MYGAFPVDPYSHTPAGKGARQPGMTGQVKEEILTRLGELGVAVDDGRLAFDVLLVRPEELLDAATAWTVAGVGGQGGIVEVPIGAVGLTCCQVPIVVTVGEHDSYIDVEYTDGRTHREGGRRLNRTDSAQIFGRTGVVRAVRATVAR